MARALVPVIEQPASFAQAQPADLQVRLGRAGFWRSGRRQTRQQIVDVQAFFTQARQSKLGSFDDHR